MSDLDGTITDPAEGIIGPINQALVELGRSAPPEADLQKYIGRIGTSPFPS